MAFRSIIMIAVCLAISSCLDPGFSGRTRQFSGVYLHEFEGSTFVEGAIGIPTQRPDYRTTDSLDWIDQPRLEGLLEENLGNGDCYTVQPILVTFIGRRTRYPFGGTGHMGLHPSKVTVHQMISAERLGPSFCYDR